MMVFVRFSFGPWASAAVGLMLSGQGCLDVANPLNCVTSGAPCEAGFVCNSETQSCEPASPDMDCVAQPSACTTETRCNNEDKRCLPRRFVLGQPDDSSNLNLSYGLCRPYAAKLLTDQADSGKTKLVVAEWGSDRALIWNEVPKLNRPADVVLGQQDLQTTAMDRPPYSALGNLYTPWSIASDGTSLLLGESSWHRLSIWSPIPRQSGIDRPLAPSGWWGQSDYLAPKIDAGLGMTHALGVKRPVAFAEQAPGRGFYVSDYGNRRVLVFDGIPTDYTKPPKWVIGQPDFVSSAQRAPQSGIGAPYGLFSDGTQLFVADELWHRVLVYNLPITRNDPTPDLVIGQPDLTSIAKNRGTGPSADSLNGPTDVAVSGQGGERKLWVVDSGNNRVLRYTLPGVRANLVLGQLNYTTVQGNLGAGVVGGIGLATPKTVSTDGTHLVVADQSNNRVHIWNTLPDRDAQPSDVIVGQPNEKSNVPYMPPAVHGLQFREPVAVSSDGTRLFVADLGHNRVLIWNRIPKDSKTPPDVVLGQRDFASSESNQGGVNASSLNGPHDVRSDGTSLAVVDKANHRVLIWNQIPTQSFASADVVLGQPAMNTNTPSATAQRLNAPEGVAFQNGSLWVSDTANHRVLRFDPPFTTNASAVRVLGQPNMTSNASNAGEGRTQRGMSSPSHVDSDGQRLVVADEKNWRVLIWDQLPTADFQPASMMVGQKAWDAVNPNSDNTIELYHAAGVHLAAGRLYVSSAWDNRILLWNQLPTSLGQPASSVLGQTDFEGFRPNDTRLAPVDRLSYPMGISSAGDQLFIADRHNNRIVITERPQ